MRSQRVLLLDDCAGIGALTRFFERFQHGRHYELLTASNPDEAISTLKQGRPDLIVLDPQMKELDGLRLLEQIRVTDTTIPIIVMTGKQTSHDAAEVLKTGVFAYVPKPCHFAAVEHLVALAPPRTLS